MGGQNSTIEIRAAAGNFSAAEFRTVAMDGDLKLFMKLMQNMKDAEARSARWRNFDNWKEYFTWRQRKEKQTAEYTEEEKNKKWDLATGSDMKSRQPVISPSTKKKKNDITKVFDVPDSDGCTALHHAAMSGTTEIVRILIEEKAEKNRLDQWGRTPLWYAASMKRLDVVRYLIEANVDINKARVNDSGNEWVGSREDGKTFGETPLHRAAEDIVQALVKGNADLNNHGMDFWLCFGETPLHRAAANGRLDVVKFLVNAGCDIDRQDADGNTALHRASYRGHLPCVQYLVEQGAAMDDLHLNNLRETPLTTASRGNVPATSWYLSSVKPAQLQDFKARRLERENKLGMTTKETEDAPNLPLVDVSVHTQTKSRAGAVGGGGGPSRRRMGSLVAQGFGGGDSSEEMMMLVPQTNNNGSKGDTAAAMQSLDAFAAAAAAGINSNSSKSLKVITEGDEGAAAADIDDNVSGGRVQVAPTDASTATVSTGRRKSSFFNFFGLGGDNNANSPSGNELPSPSSTKCTTVAASAATTAAAAENGPGVETSVKAIKAAATGKKMGSQKQHHSPPKSGKNNGESNEWLVVEGSPAGPDSRHAAADAAGTGPAKGFTATSKPPHLLGAPVTISSADAPTAATAPSGLESQGGPGQGLEGANTRKRSRKPSRVVLPPLKQQQQQQPLAVVNTVAADTVAVSGRQRSQSVSVDVAVSATSPQSQSRHRSKSEKSSSRAPPSPKVTKTLSESEKHRAKTSMNSGLNQSGKVAPDS